MGNALNKTGRPILYSICNWGDSDTLAWAPEIGNSWRTTDDIWLQWASVERIFFSNNDGREKAGPGGWNDADMLEVGNSGLSEDEEKSHFALWVISKSPLIIGCDLVTVSNSSLAILKNRALIEVSQDTLGQQASCKKACSFKDWVERNPQVYSLPMANGDIVVVVMNWKQKAVKNLKFTFAEVGIPDAWMDVKDLWQDGEVLE